MLCCVFWLVLLKCLGRKCLGGKFLRSVNASTPASTWMVRYAISSKNLMTSGGRAPKCSKKNRSTQYFVPGLRHASFGPICRHVCMSKNAVRADLSCQMKKTTNQHATHTSRISAKLGHPTGWSLKKLALCELIFVVGYCRNWYDFCRFCHVEVFGVQITQKTCIDW